MAKKNNSETVKVELKYHNPFVYAMEELTTSVLKTLGSAKRLAIINCIRRGFEHPEDIARELDSTTQSIDKQVEMLILTGLVEKKATTHENGIPKVALILTQSG